MVATDADPAPPRVRWAAGAFVALLLAGLVSFIALRCSSDPSHPFLPAAEGADWIAYPTPPQTAPHLAVERTTTFSRAFELDAVPAESVLRWRSFRRARISLNGQLVHATELQHADWKRERTVDLTGHLVAGRNRLEIEVRNDLGPPALWAVVDAGALTLSTDASFEASAMGARWMPARSTSVPMTGWSSEGVPDRVPIRLPGALSESLGAALWALLGGGVLGLWFRRRRTQGGLTRRESAVLFGIVTLCWTVLFGLNAERVVHVAGFDAEAHAEYVEIVRSGHLPLADEGWETYQPPLYYLTAAGLLNLVGASALEPDGVAWLRYLMGALGLIQVLLAFLTVRLVFPRNALAQVTGLVLAAFLPAQLYVLHYVSNEGLAGALVTLVVWLTVSALRTEFTLKRAFGIGCALGAALLAKFSALIVTPVVLVVLVARFLTQRGFVFGAIAGRLALVASGIALVSGWHFVRVWRAFGRPLVGNWEVELGWAWWQDPGYHDAGYYLGFSRSLSEPIFAGFHSFADAMHSTLWGDALLGGSASSEWLLPWRPEAMALAYVLALVPAVGIVCGSVAGTVRWIRRPSAELALLLGAVGAVLFAVAFMTTQLPYYAQARSIYALSALAPLVALCASGLAVMAGRSALGRATMVGFIGAWGTATFVSFLAPDSARTHAALALALAERSPEAATAPLQRALELDPDLAVVQRARAHCAHLAGDWATAVEASQRAIELDPTFAGAHVQLASAELQRQNREVAYQAVVTASQVDPDSFDAAANRGLILRGNPGEAASAEAALRDALRIDPQHGGVHALLAGLLYEQGRAEEGARHQRWSMQSQLAIWNQAGQFEDAVTALGEALEARPDPQVALWLAELLATSPDATLRDGERAIELASRATAQMGGEEHAVAALAAAYAEAGRFDDALRTQRELALRYEDEGGAPPGVLRRLALFEAGKAVPAARSAASVDALR